MICPRCQRELPEDSLFCSGCGYSFKDQQGPANEKKSNKNIIKAAIISAVVIAVIGISAIFINKQIQLNKVVKEFQVLVDDEKYKDALIYYEDNGMNDAFARKADSIVQKKYDDAVENSDNDVKISLFNSGLMSDEYVKQIEQSIVPEMENLKTKYVASEISYDDVKTACDIYSQYNNDSIASTAKTVGTYCKNLFDSRQAYETGIEAADNKKYESALSNLTKVIEDDTNYVDAQNRIDEIVDLYKAEVMADVETNVASDNYSAAISSLEALSKYCSDSDVSSKLASVKEQKTAYDEEQEKIKIEGYKNNQQVEVTSARVWNDGYYLTFMKAEVVVKNNSEKIAKDVSFGTLLFDGNGYPVDVEYKLYQGTYSNEFRCAHSSCNIEAGKSYGSGWEFNIPDQCKKVKACVREVTYTDGTTWNNPYYEYWLSDNHSAY